MISRRAFFRQTTAALTALFLLPHRKAEDGIPLATCHIAGFQYHDGPEILHSLRPGTRLTLRREPNNPHDCRAIAVYAADRHIGYISRAINTIPAGMMDRGQRLTATINAVVQKAPPWEMVEMGLCIAPQGTT